MANITVRQITSAANIVANSGLPSAIKARSAEISPVFLKAAELSLTARSTVHNIPERFAAATEGLFAGQGSRDAEALAKTMILSRSCIRDFVRTAERLKGEDTRDALLSDSLSDLERAVRGQCGKLQEYSFAPDIPMLLACRPQFDSGLYFSAIREVLGSSWFSVRQERFRDVDIVSVVGNLEHGICGGTVDSPAERGTIFIAGNYQERYSRNRTFLQRLLVHEERHIYGYYNLADMFFLQDVADGFKTFRSQETGLPGERTRTNLIGEMHAGIEDLQYLTEECPSPPKKDLSAALLHCLKMRKWADLIRLDIDPFRPMDPYDPLEEPLNAFFCGLVSGLSLLESRIRGIMDLNEGRDLS